MGSKPWGPKLTSWRTFKKWHELVLWYADSSCTLNPMVYNLKYLVIQSIKKLAMGTISKICLRLFVCLMVFNTTFNNISVKSWRLPVRTRYRNVIWFNIKIGRFNFVPDEFPRIYWVEVLGDQNITHL